MQMELGLLKVSGDVRLAESVRTGVRGAEQLSPLVKEFPRKISLVTLAEVIDQAKRQFDPAGRNDGVASDAWIGPRLHAALRLTRAEAAMDGVWLFLSVYAFPDYVIWRWPIGSKSEKSEQPERFFGSDVKKHAFKRLWWTAELFRNGPDYGTARKAFLRSDVPNTLTGIDAVHSRPVALGVLDFVENNEVGSRQVNDLTRQLNSSAVTVALDRAYVSQDEATELDEAWIGAEPDLQEVMIEPIGPRHGEVDEIELTRVRTALDDIIDTNVLRSYRK